jgi:hypothetical protein
MLKPLILLVTTCCFFVTVHAQNAADTIPINKDSIEKEIDAFLSLMDSLNKPKSYFMIAMGVGNQQFSVNNTALNALQTNPGINFIPSFAYNHKSGFGIMYNNYINVNGSGIELFQHTLTPSYTFSNSKIIDAGVSYTRYFSSNSRQAFSSPYKNDIYAYAELKKWNYKPSLAFGFANGGFKETSVIDTFGILKRPVRPDTIVFFKQFDTLNTRLKDYSIIAGISRDFSFSTRSSKSYITFTPTLMLLFGWNNYDVEYISRPELTPELLQFLRRNPYAFKQLAAQFPSLNRSRNFDESGNFNLQSLGLNLDATWYIGKFFFNPQVYFDYYLLSSQNKFNILYTVQAGFMF